MEIALGLLWLVSAVSLSLSVSKIHLIILLIIYLLLSLFIGIVANRKEVE